MCDECGSRYYLTELNTCVPCTVCGDGCNEFAPYLWQSDLCVPCYYSCYDCTDPTLTGCVSCYDYHYFYNDVSNTCDECNGTTADPSCSCHDSCLTCDDQN